MAAPKLTKEDCEKITKLINEGHQIKDLAKKYNVHRSTIEKRCKDKYKSRKVPIEVKNKVRKKISEGYTKAEAAQLYGLNIGTVVNFTRDLKGHSKQGNHIIRQNGIKLLKRLMSDGYLITDFIIPTARNLQMHFPTICSARYKDKTFFYLKGREEETIEAFFREKPDRIINYSSIEELSYLLGVKISKHDQKNLLDKYKGKHADYWRSRHLIQRSLTDFDSDCIFYHEVKWAEPGFKLMPKI